ncbi:hypothetical protein [Prochlorococcus sp. MIT 1313]
MRSSSQRKQSGLLGIHDSISQRVLSVKNKTVFGSKMLIAQSSI